MNTDCHIIVIDDHEIIATGCQGEFAKAGLPWSVIWARNLSDIDWPEGQTLAVLDLRLNDGSRPAEIIAELSRRSIPDAKQRGREHQIPSQRFLKELFFIWVWISFITNSKLLIFFSYNSF